MPECGHNKKRFGVTVNFPDRDQIQRLSFWLAVSILIVAPLEVFHLLLELLHILFEWAEEGLDFVIELVFDTSLHSTQVIVFYILASVFFFGCYRLWRGLPAFYQRQKIHLSDFLSNEINIIQNYWHQSIANKLKLSAAIAMVLALFFM